jgi:hypothetical protein
MANLINIDAESGANIIGDDATATLTFSNTSTGPGLESRGLVAVSGASIDRLTISNAFAGAANATIVGLNLTGNSIASGAVISLKNKSSYVSTTTIKATTAVAANCGAIRIVKPDGTFGWIPVYPDAAVTAVVV